jgi:phage-related protein
VVIRIPVNLDVTDNDIAESIEDEVDRGARRARGGRAGDIIGRALGIGIGDGIQNSIGDGVSRGITRSVSAARPGIQTFGQLGFSLAQVAAGALTAVGAITPLGGALGGLVAGAVAVAGALAQAAAAAVSVGGVLASVGLAAGVSQLASRGLSDAFAAQSAAQEELSRTGAVSAATQADLTAAMDALAPSAREVVTQVQALAPAWSAMQSTVQGAFFEGLAGSIQSVSDAALPTLQSRFTETAGIINAALQSFAGFASSEQFVSRVDTVLATLNTTLQALLPGLGQIGDALFTIFEGALGEAPGLAQVFTDLATRFNEFIQGAADSGALATFFQQAVDIGGTLLGIIGNVGSILGSVFGEGAGVGATLLSVLERVTGTLAEFLNTAGAQAGLQEFFGLVSQTGDTIAGLGAVIGPIFTGIFAVIGELIPHINALRDALLPVAVAIGEALGTALVGLAPALGLIAGLIVGLVQVLAPLIEALVGALGPALAEIGALFVEHLGPAIEGLIPLLAPVIEWFSGVLVAQIQNAVNLIVTVLGSVFKILGGLIDLVVGVFTGDWERAWTGIKNIFSGVVDAIVGVVNFLWNTIINQVTGGSTRMRNIVTQVNEFIQRSFDDAVDNVIGFFRGLPDQILIALGNLSLLLYNAGQNVIQGLIDGIRSMINRVGSAMGTIASKIRSYLPFSPAKEGPLSGVGNPENSGQKIVEMLSSGIDSGVELPARALASVLTPLTPAGAQSALPGAAGVATATAGTVINQNFFGPTTSGGRLQEMNWTTRYATQARTETVGGVAT